MTVKILCLGMGGVGIVSSYVLSLNQEVELTAVIRSDYDVVKEKGYTISSVDYGGKRKNGDPKEHENTVKGFRPHNVVKSLLEVTEAFDYIVVSTKVIPRDDKNIWNEVADVKDIVFKPNKGTSVVLMQNGIDIEKYWSELYPVANFISGVTYVGSVNSNGNVSQDGYDRALLGLFEFNSVNNEVGRNSLKRLVSLYSNEYNTISIDTNVRLTRWRKLLYNASFNTVCCISDLDVGKVFDLKDTENIIARVITPLMQEIKLVANLDLSSIHSKDSSYNEYVTDEHITYITNLTEECDAATNYKPSMLVDSRLKRPIELEIILGNVISIYSKLRSKSPKDDLLKSDIPCLSFLYSLLTLVQFRLTTE